MSALQGYRIAYHQGDKLYLLVPDGQGKDGPSPTDTARLLDLARGRLFPPHSLHNHLAQGYYEPYEGEQDVLPGLLRKVGA